MGSIERRLTGTRGCYQQDCAGCARSLVIERGCERERVPRGGESVSLEAFDYAARASSTDAARIRVSSDDAVGLEVRLADATPPRGLSSRDHQIVIPRPTPDPESLPTSQRPASGVAIE